MPERPDPDLASANEQTAPIEPIRAADVAGWDLDADVVVVGLGCAGASAAIEAAEAGADVLALEAAAMGGGTSAMSGGLIYLGGGTPVQESCGYTDTPEDMERFLLAACPGTDPTKVRAYCQGSVEHYHWLVDHGVPFEGRFCEEPNREPPDTAGLVFSGGEDSWPFDEIAPPVPRGHHPEFPDAAGGFLMQRLLEAVAASGTRVVADAQATRLVVDDAGAVVGLEARIDEVTRLVRARRGVVLAAGGFMFNREMVERHCAVALRANVPIGTPFDDGRAIRMAQGAGAATAGMEHIEVGIPLTPPRRLVRGILVNGEGRRFMNEDTYAGRLGKEFLLHQDGRVFFVHSDDTFEVNIVGYKPRWVAATAAELEAEIGLPEGSLQATLDRYNEHAAHLDDPDFHKATEWVVPLLPPYGVVDLGVDKSYYATFTLGGLVTTADSVVLDEAGSPIAGLFAAGRTTVGIAGAGYVSGISLGDGTYFGRRAGRSAAT